MPSESRSTAESTAVGAEILHLRHVFGAPPRRVFAAFTDPQILANWFGPKATKTEIIELDLRVGGNYRFAMHMPDGGTAGLSGTYIEITPPERLIFSWSWAEGITQDSEVTLEFQDHEIGTELVLTHRKLPNIEQRDLHGSGWSSSFESLTDLLEGGK